MGSLWFERSLWLSTAASGGLERQIDGPFMLGQHGMRAYVGWLAYLAPLDVNAVDWRVMRYLQDVMPDRVCDDDDRGLLAYG